MTVALYFCDLFKRTMAIMQGELKYYSNSMTIL